MDDVMSTMAVDAIWSDGPRSHADRCDVEGVDVAVMIDPELVGNT